MRSLLPAAALVLVACSRPEPPTLTPEAAAVTAITPVGIDLRGRFDVYNPNDIGLATRAVSARVVLGGQYDVGTVTVPTALDLPAKKHTRLDVPLSVKWRDLAGIAALAARSSGVPYQVDGTVTLGGETLNVELPFRLGGTIPQEQLIQAVKSSLPGFPLPSLR
jgi:LEA14-like dessication related protein